MESPPTLSADAIDDLLYAARAPDLDFLRELLSELSSSHRTSPPAILDAAVDAQSGNGPVHYAAANNCTDILTYTLALCPSLVTRANAAANTPLHYAALNGHLDAARLLLAHLVGADVLEYLTAKNAAGHDAAFEAESAGKEDVVNWLLGKMDEVERGGGGGEISVGVGEEEEEEEAGKEGEDVELMRVRVGEMDVDGGGDGK